MDRNVTNRLYGMSDQEVAELCKVSLSTVYRWRAKKHTIPHGIKLLLKLHADRRILPEAWFLSGFQFQGNQLNTPVNQQFNHVQIEQFSWHYSLYRSTETNNKELNEYIDYLEAVLPRADVIPFDRNKTRPSLTEGKEANRLFNKPESI